ncbi:MAG: hypothetical protein Q4B47_01050 [Eubacteriales bacterium]|nr:hypothetical protein [Eubacteriales bacterium]
MGTDISQTKQKSKIRKRIKKELESYREQNVDLFLNGHPSSPSDIAKACQLAEGGVYMRDYTEDQQGKIVCVNFDFVDKV